MSRVRQIVPDAIGIISLAGLATLVAWAVAALYTKEDAIWAWAIGFPIMAICALVAWYDRRWPSDSQDVLLYGLVSIPVGGISLAIDFLIGSSMYPQLPFRYAIWEAGSPFGIILTICICPGYTLVALSGAVRSLLLTKDTDSAR